MSFLVGFLAACITWFLIAFVPPLILTLIFGERSGITQGVAAFCVLLIGPFFAFKVWGRVWRSRCPSCGALASKIVGGYTSSYDTTRTETTRFTNYNTRGKEIGYSETDYEVPHTVTTVHDTRRCSSCGHTWTR